MTQYFVPCKVSLHAFHLCVFPCFFPRSIFPYFSSDTRKAPSLHPHTAPIVKQVRPRQLCWPGLSCFRSCSCCSISTQFSEWVYLPRSKSETRTDLHGFALDSHRIFADSHWNAAGCIHWRWSLWLPVCNAQLQHLSRVQHVSKFCFVMFLVYVWYVLICVVYCSVDLYFAVIRASRVGQGPQANFRTFFQANTCKNIIHSKHCQTNIGCVWKLAIPSKCQFISIFIHFQ